jgi:hypothetical protein
MLSSMAMSFLFRKHIEEDETLLRVVHKHWLLGVRSLFWPTLLLLVLWSLLYAVQTRGFLVIVSSISVGVGVWWLRNFFDYYLDAWLVTDHGIIDIAWHGWFHRQSARILYSDLQGISYEIKGVLGTILRYGTITVEKVSTGDSITLENVSNPRSVETLVLQRMEAYLHAKNLKDGKQVQKLLSAIVAQHMQLQELQGAENDDES